MASLTSSDDPLVKEVFLRQPPPPFDCDFMRAERGSSDTDKDWLPKVSDIISGNCHVMVDLTGNSDSEVYQHSQETQCYPGPLTTVARRMTPESPSMHPRSDSGTVLASPYPTRTLPSFFNQRSPPACQPSTANDLDWEQVESPETPGATLVSLVAHMPSRYHRGAVAVYANEDSSQEQEEEQGRAAEGPDWEDSNSDRGGGGFPPSRQPDAPIPASTFQFLKFGMLPEGQSPEAMIDHQLGS